MHQMFMLQDGHCLVLWACLPKAGALHQQTRAVSENQLISSHQFAEHLKQRCTQNSTVTATDASRWKRHIEKDCKQQRGYCLGGGLGGSPFKAWPNLAELEGRGWIMRLGVCHMYVMSDSHHKSHTMYTIYQSPQHRICINYMSWLYAWAQASHSTKNAGGRLQHAYTLEPTKSEWDDYATVGV